MSTNTSPVILAPEKKAVILLFAGAIQFDKKLGQNHLSGIFRLWRKFLRENHPDRNANPDEISLRLIADGSGGDIGHVGQDNKYLRHAIFSIAMLAQLGVFKARNMQENPYVDVMSAVQRIRTSVISFNILARGEKRDAAKSALAMLLHREPFSAALKKEFSAWDAPNAKARSKSSPKAVSRARSRALSTRRKGPLLIRGRSAARSSSGRSQLSDIILSPVRRSPPRRSPPRAKTTGRTRQIPTAAEIDALNARKPCPDPTKVRWPPTGRCRKIKECPTGTYRNPSTGRCKKMPGALKPCKTGHERNPVTNRCRKIR